jgi:hypothetical protein
MTTQAPIDNTLTLYEQTRLPSEPIPKVLKIEIVEQNNGSYISVYFNDSSKAITFSKAIAARLTDPNVPWESGCDELTVSGSAVHIKMRSIIAFHISTYLSELGKIDPDSRLSPIGYIIYDIGLMGLKQIPVKEAIKLVFWLPSVPNELAWRNAEKLLDHYWENRNRTEDSNYPVATPEQIYELARAICINNKGAGKSREILVQVAKLIEHAEAAKSIRTAGEITPPKPSINDKIFSDKSNGQIYQLLCKNNIFTDRNEQKNSFALSHGSSRKAYQEHAIEKMEEANFIFKN